MFRYSGFQDRPFQPLTHPTAFLGRYYHTLPNGTRKQKADPGEEVRSVSQQEGCAAVTGSADRQHQFRGRPSKRPRNVDGLRRKEIGKLKTERSAGTVPLIDPLRSLLERHRPESPEGFILQNSSGKPLDLDSINTRIITPALEKAGIE